MALGATTIFDVRITGADTNGGGFLPGASGTDWSQQASAQYALTGIASAGSGNTILSTLAAADMVGNVAQAISGTNINVGFYQVVSVSVGVSITFGTNISGASICTGVAASGVINIGGSFASVNQAIQAMTVTGMIAYVKSGSAYTRSSTISCGNNVAITLIGYTTSRGDNGQVSVTTASNIALVTMTNGGQFTWKNFIFSSTSGTKGYAFFSGGAFLTMWINFVNCLFTSVKAAVSSNGGTTVAFNISMYNTEISGCTNVALEFASGTSSLIMADCFLHGSTSDGILCSSSALNASLVRTIIYSNGGKGINLSSGSGHQISLYNCVIASNTSDGLTYGSSSPQITYLTLENNIIQSNGGWGVNWNTTGGIYFQAIRNNAFRNNTSGKYTTVISSTNEITLTGDPFNSAGTDFSLNSTSGAGALCRAGGFPGTLVSSGTGYIDVGPLQHQDSPAINTLVVAPRITQYIGEVGL